MNGSDTEVADCLSELAPAGMVAVFWFDADSNRFVPADLHDGFEDLSIRADRDLPFDELVNQPRSRVMENHLVAVESLDDFFFVLIQPRRGSFHGRLLFSCKYCRGAFRLGMMVRRWITSPSISNVTRKT